MWYRNRPYRRMRGGRGFMWWPFLFPFMVIWFSHGSMGAFMGTLILISVVMLVIRAIVASNGGGSMWRGQWNGNQWGQQQQPPQQPYYQPPPQDQQYQSYEQGYHAPASTASQGEQPSHQASGSQYDNYEQPQAQYPQEMPPMQQ